MTVTAIIVDDEPLARSRLKRMLRGRSVVVVAEGCNGDEAVELSRRHHSDVLFLDINMPVRNGLSAAEEIQSSISNPPSIIFCTAYDEYALEAFKSNASAYLLKPISLESLDVAMEQAGRINRLQVSRLESDRADSSSTFTIGENESLENISIGSVSYFRSLDKHVYAQIDSKGEVLVNYTLKALQEMFNGNVLRVHRSTLVNQQRLVKLLRHDDGLYYVLLNGTDREFQVSRRHLKEVKDAFKG